MGNFVSPVRSFFVHVFMLNQSVFELARRKYLPSPVQVLFLTEAPPMPDKNRFFYVEHVRQGDSLFLELMKVLFPEEVAAFDSVKALRAEKVYFLERFRNEGFYLMNAFDRPLPHTTATFRSKQYREYLPELVQQIAQITTNRTPIVIVSAVAYEGCAVGLREAGFAVLNESKIEYPNSGQQVNFRRKLQPLLETHGWLPKPI